MCLFYAIYVCLMCSIVPFACAYFRVAHACLQALCVCIYVLCLLWLLVWSACY
uniref:Uncharacterized protein n=1 Tax=Anguilla anguilla TaxID=7936 RepID=A0A0E9TTF7_ANGAN